MTIYEKGTQLVCPNCNSAEGLGTAESIHGHAGASFWRKPNGKIEIVHDGHTEVWWDSSTSHGVHCKSCDWGIDNYPDNSTDKFDESAAELVAEEPSDD